MCTKTGINIPREYIQPYFIEKYENEKFVKIRKISKKVVKIHKIRKQVVKNNKQVEQNVKIHKNS